MGESISRWEDIEYFDTAWIHRIKFMSKYIPKGSSVMDLGCGKMWLRDILKEVIYIPVDYVDRDATTIVCDFNKHQFPNKSVDVIFVSGCLEYVKDHEWFISEISNHAKKCVISYCTIEAVPNIIIRKRRAWVNSLKKEELIKLFNKNGMDIMEDKMFDKANRVFIFAKHIKENA
ncbi:MAG TPA: methyltransferase domain-containing protein [Bacteroidia bacterium]|jgi:hypothetical protein|nr:methyltransferase domain-containing protein [Bacteroidia bacterium]